MSQLAVDPFVQLQVERFFTYEAWLLDERRFYEWLELFADDARYSISVRQAPQADGAHTVAPPAPLVVDDIEFLRMRVKRLETRLAHAEQPPSLTRHFVSNILIHGRALDAEMRTTCNFLVFQTRIDIAEHTFAGKRDDLLRKVNGEWRIGRRDVLLDRAPLPSAISIFF